MTVTHTREEENFWKHVFKTNHQKAGGTRDLQGWAADARAGEGGHVRKVLRAAPLLGSLWAHSRPDKRSRAASEPADGGPRRRGERSMIDGVLVGL